MKPSYSWNYRRILPDDFQPALEPRSPFTEAVERCLAERRRSIQVVGYGGATLAVLFALCFLILGRMSVATIGPDSVIPTNPESASGFEERVNALGRENTLLIKALQKAQTAVEDLQDLAARRALDFKSAEASGTAAATLPSVHGMTTVADKQFTPGL